MAVCDVSLVLGASGFACPSQCPYWSQSAVWKGVGVCTTAERCSVYNPRLTYADPVSRVCLPCDVYGCATCAYSQATSAAPVFRLNNAAGSATLAGSQPDSGVALPDVCLECAPGYRMADEGRSCYLVKSSIWSRSFYTMVAGITIALAALCVRLLVRPSLFRANLDRYRQELGSHRGGHGSSKLGRGIIGAMLALMNEDIAGIGVMLYFRFLAFVLGTTLVLLLLSVAHAHIPCSDMIRSLGEAFSLDRPDDVLVDPSWLSWLGFRRAPGWRQHLLNFRIVDDAITWSVSQYVEDNVRTMHVLYVAVMGITLAFAWSQHKFIREYFKRNPRVQSFTLVLERVPPFHTLEDFVENASGVRPKSVTVAYDIEKASEGLREFLDLQDDEASTGVYVNLDMALEHRRVLESLEPSGTAYAVFHTRMEMRKALISLNRSGICNARLCDVEPEDVDWYNIFEGDGLLRRAAEMTAAVCATQLFWTLVFFMPYAAYKLHAGSTDLFEALWLYMFTGVGNGLVAASIRKATEKVQFASVQSAESYNMWLSTLAELLNVGLNVLLAHFNNYGGHYKVLSMVKDFALYKRTATFSVGEEVSITQSLSTYMVNVILLVPAMAFVLVRYGTPLMGALYVLAADLDGRVSHLLRPAPFELNGRYGSAVVNFTFSLLLQYVIRSRMQSFIIAFALLASYAVHYVIDAYVLINKAEPSRLTGTTAFRNALMMWAVPTGILAACPSYWRWRGMDGYLATSFVIFGLHVFFYCTFIYFICRPRDHLEGAEDNTSPSDYSIHNPVYKLRRLAGI
ncbi:membrane protein, putative [Babesia bigemina]|uniref:Membrane protein, putative n=1 Tax=Babesia bigemina TaxID=5866 RepID=A0A061DCB9_BABBI|nr:membrane protein, putative [Babesia bigemina]CDR96624.1 membrane protein, putative [Babesia bigemina]|eukprot:XP_012768810.1 membrane protein, putative [Babesia bigemina]